MIHGLRLRSDVPLPEPGEAGDSDPDLIFREVEPDLIPGGAPTGRVLVDQAWGEFGLAIADDGDRLVIRFHELCEFRTVSGDRDVEVCRKPGLGNDIAASLLIGGALPCLLALRGDRLLHASAVHYRGQTLAIVGGSGAGKSKLAAEFCAAGGELVTDDVLRIEQRLDRVECHRGTTRILMHSANQPLVSLFSADLVSPSWDGRLALSPPAVSAERLRLDAVLVPSQGAVASIDGFRALGRSAAIEALERETPRESWQLLQADAVRRRELEDLASRVPIMASRD